MELTRSENGGGQVLEHSSSKSSESSQMEKQVGNAHVMQKSQSMEEEEVSRMVSQSEGGPSLESVQTTLREIIEEEAAGADATAQAVLAAAGVSHTLHDQPQVVRRGAAGLLCLLAKERPSSLPPDLAHLCHSLKIANELNKSLGKDEEVDEDETETEKTSYNGVSKPIDLQKLFTPAPDPELIVPKRKLFSSSSFYGPEHPTVEEQVELARRISSSLSDISNKESKGQSMYVNRKKRSVKWVHTGDAKEESISEYSELSRENLPPPKGVGGGGGQLKLVMNPRGKVQDGSFWRHDPSPSPEIPFDLVKDLNSPCGKGAELFAKRRKRSEKWVVDSSNVKQGSSLTETVHQETRPPPTPTYLKDVPIRFQPSANPNLIPERFTQPKLKLIKSPWEAALEGRVEAAFEEPAGGSKWGPRGSGSLVAPSPPLPAPTAPATTSDQAALYRGRPPRAWHPQPTCNTFSVEEAGPLTGPSAAPRLAPLDIHVDLSNLGNFNTAPRGWQSNMSYYRPVTFSYQQQYSDL